MDFWSNQRLKFIVEYLKINSGAISIHHIKTIKQLANHMTKPLNSEQLWLDGCARMSWDGEQFAPWQEGVLKYPPYPAWRDHGRICSLVDVCQIPKEHHKPNGKTQIHLLPKIYYVRHFSYVKFST